MRRHLRCDHDPLANEHDVNAQSLEYNLIIEDLC